MLKPVHEPYNGPISYPLSAALQALANEDIKSIAGNDLNQPFGAGDTVGFEAGLVAKLIGEGGSTVIDLPAAGGDNPTLILADGYSDSLKSGKAAGYPLIQGGIFKCKGNYDVGQSYAVGTQLTFIPSGVNKGKLTPASVYSSQKIVAEVIEPPVSAADDDEMVIQTVYQVVA